MKTLALLSFAGCLYVTGYGVAWAMGPSCRVADILNPTFLLLSGMSMPGIILSLVVVFSNLKMEKV